MARSFHLSRKTLSSDEALLWNQAETIEAVLLVSTVVIFSPTVLAAETDSWRLGRLVENLPSLLVLMALALGVLVAIGLAARTTGLLQHFRAVVTILSMFVVVTTFAFPLVETTAMLEPAQAQVHVLHLLLSGLLAIALYWLSSRNRRLVLLGVGIYVSANLVVALLVLSLYRQAVPFEDVALSSDRNLVILSFDGLSGLAMAELLKSRGELANPFGGFTVYTEAIATSPATSASIVSELSGNSDMRAQSDDLAEIWELRRPSLVTTRLLENGYRVLAYGAYSAALDTKRSMIEASVYSDAPQFLLINSAVARSGSPWLVIEGKLASLARGLVSELSFSGEASELEEAVAASALPDWDRALILSADDLNPLRENIEVEGERPVALFMHFTHTHYPVKWDSSCHFRANDVVWFSEHQNRIGDLEQSECALRQVGSFVTKLSELGVLEDALVVLKSDHGKPTPYAAGMERAQINDHDLWGLSRYSAFLAVKTPGSSDASPVFDESPVLLDDLARTVCSRAQIDFGCDTFPGFDITSSESIDALCSGAHSGCVVAAERLSLRVTRASHDSERGQPVGQPP